MDEKSTLREYLRLCRAALLAKLDGLGEYDVRRPMTPTGTNLLGLVKHVASVELGYFGEVFDRPSGEPLPWMDEGAEPNADFWATPEESTADILAPGRVPWWPRERQQVTLHTILVHMVAELCRHAGHADILA